MSSFTSAHYLVGDLDPDAVAVTFDPANMVIEGKEDWGYGVQLLREHVANVHIKNVSWLRQGAPGSGTGMGCGGAWWTGHNCSACWPTPATAGCSPWKISASRRISTRRWFTCENCEETRSAAAGRVAPGGLSLPHSLEDTPRRLSNSLKISSRPAAYRLPYAGRVSWHAARLSNCSRGGAGNYPAGHCRDFNTRGTRTRQCGFYSAHAQN